MICVAITMKEKKKRVKFSRRVVIYYVALMLHRKANGSVWNNRNWHQIRLQRLEKVPCTWTVLIHLVFNVLWLLNQKHNVAGYSITKGSLPPPPTLKYFFCTWKGRNHWFHFNARLNFLQTLTMFGHSGWPWDMKKSYSFYLWIVFLILLNCFLIMYTDLPFSFLPFFFDFLFLFVSFLSASIERGLTRAT